MFIRFLRSEQFGGILLLACTIVSLALAISAVGEEYLAFWRRPLGPLSLEHWINDSAPLRQVGRGDAGDAPRLQLT